MVLDAGTMGSWQGNHDGTMFAQGPLLRVDIKSRLKVLIDSDYAKSSRVGVCTRMVQAPANEQRWLLIPPMTIQGRR